MSNINGSFKRYIYNSMVIDSDIDSRMRLKQAMTAVSCFGKGSQVTQLSEGLAKLELGELYDVIFISSRLQGEEAMRFISKAKEHKASQDAAFVLILPTKNQQSSTVAKSVLNGYDGLLFEPYSADGLMEITQLAERVKSERSAAREKVALEFILKDCVNYIDQIAVMKQHQMEAGTAQKKLKELHETIKALDEVKRIIYFDAAVTIFEDAPLPKPMLVNRYGGVSNRIKKKMEERMIAELEKPGEPAK